MHAYDAAVEEALWGPGRGYNMARGLPTQAPAVPAAAVLAMEAVVHAAPVWRRIPAAAPGGGGGEFMKMMLLGD